MVPGRLVRPSFHHRFASHFEIGSGFVRGVDKDLTAKSEWGHLSGKLGRACAGLRSLMRDVIRASS